MQDIVIYHNPRCSKSRQTLQLLADQGVEPVIVRYLETPPSAADLRRLLDLLGLDARELARRKESAWTDLGLEDADAETIINAMSQHPVLIERPIVVAGERAVLGRPPENVLELLAERAS